MIVAPRFNLDQELLVVAMCKALNDAATAGLNDAKIRARYYVAKLPCEMVNKLSHAEEGVALAADAEAVRRQNLYRTIKA